MLEVISFGLSVVVALIVFSFLGLLFDLLAQGATALWHRWRKPKVVLAAA